MRVECEINLTLLVRAMIDALKVVVAGASERCAEIDQGLERAALSPTWMPSRAETGIR
jgi:hypothetical protein